MSIERLTPDDMSWTGHSIQAQQYHMDHMYHYHETSIHNYNCPLDPCRNVSLRGSVLSLQPLRSDDTEHSRRREEEDRARKERREREEKERRERDQYVAEEREKRRARERGEEYTQSRSENTLAPRESSHQQDLTPRHTDYSTPAPTYASPTAPTYNSRDIAREAADSTRRNISDTERTARLIKNEYSDAMNISGLDKFLNKDNTISKQFSNPSDTFLVSTISTAYTLVATVATHNLAAYRADVYDRERRDFADDMLTIAKENQAAAVVNKQTAFADYEAQVASAKGYERAAMTTLEQTRDTRMEAAQTAQSSAESKYKTDVAEIERAQAREQRTYTAMLQGIESRLEGIQNSAGVQHIRMEKQEKLDNAQAVYTSKKDEILQRRETALAAIDPSTPIAAAQRREVTAKFDKDLTTLDAQYSKDVARIEKKYTEHETNKIAKYDRNTAELQAQRTQLIASHNQATQDFESRLAGARTERDSAVTKAQQDIARAQADFSRDSANLAERVSTRVTELERPKTQAEHAADIAAKAVAGAELARTDDKAAKTLKSTLTNRQADLSEYLVSRFGTAEEKQLINAYIDDRKAEQEAQKTGALHISTLSDADKTEVEKVLIKYGNTDCSSEKSIEGAIAAMQKMLPQLEEAVKMDTRDFEKATAVVKNIQVKRDNLLNKVGGDTSKLSEADKKTLGKLDKDLSQAQKKEKQAAGKLENSRGALALLKNQSATMNKHKGILPKIGTKFRQKLENQQNEKGYQKATDKVKRSLTGTLHKFNNATGVYNNAIMRSEREFKGQLAQIRKDVDFAAKTIDRTVQVSAIATKMLYRGGSVLAKGANVFLSKSSMFRATRDRFAAQAAKHPRIMAFLNGGKGLAKDGAKLLGKAAPIAKKALYVPGKIIGGVTAVATFNIEDMERKMWETTGDLVMKGVRVGTKKATNAVKKKAGEAMKRGVQKGREKIRIGKQQLKNGVRSVGKGAKYLGGALNRRFGQSKVWKTVSSAGKAVGRGLSKVAGALGRVGKAILAPFKAIGSIIGKLLSAVSSILSSVLGALASVLASVGTIVLQALLFLIICIIFIALLIAAIDAIFKIFGDPADEQIKVSYDPSFVMNLGSNYRNVEISILEFFSEEGGWTSNDAYNNKVECNNDPLYYAVFNNSFDWFGLADDGKDINQYKDGSSYKREVNEAAYNAYKTYFASIEDLEAQGRITHLNDGKKFWETLASWARNMYNAIAETWNDILEEGEYSTFGDVWEKQYSSAVRNIEKERFHSLVTTYDKVSAQYYKGLPGESPVPSNYEVSNAKDALAMMDAIYTMDSEMTRVKVLRYLGVGEYTLTQHNIPKKSLKVDEVDGKSIDQTDNLFWRSHKIEYASGTTHDSIVFHPQLSTSGEGLTKVGVSGPLGVNDPGYGILTKECENYATIAVKYTLQDHANGDEACGYWKQNTRSNYYLVEPSDGAWKDLDMHYSSAHPSYVDVWFYPEVDAATTTVYGGDGSSKTYATKQTVRCSSNHYRGTVNGVPQYAPCRWTVWGDVGDGFYIRYYKDHLIYGNRATYGTYTTGWTWKTYSTCPHKQEKNDEFQYCLGHAALKANIYVAVGDVPVGKTSIYDIAQTLAGPITYEVGGLFTWSEDLDIRAGGSPGPETINPSEEWGDSGLRGLALGKVIEKLEYYADSNGDFTEMKTKHGEISNNQILIHCDSDMLLHHALYFKDNVFYQSDFLPGEQKDLEVRSGSVNGTPIKISFIGAPNGVQYGSW